MYSTVTDGKGKTVKYWNRMRNSPGYGGIFYQCEEYACMQYEILLHAYFTQHERYWYGICDILVLIFNIFLDTQIEDRFFIK